jgi:XTP/dITP diphosphohydrolase
MAAIVLCTGNEGKVAELRALLTGGVELLSLAQVGLPADLPETGDTLEANAVQKAQYAHERCGLPCIADDTGLEVQALGGAPGVYSARYAGAQRDPQANMARLLAALEGEADRRARFRTVLALVDGTGVHTFEGVVEGRIIGAPRGTGGFGYDPIFVPDQGDRTFAELDKEAKNAISHRGRAVALLVRHLAEHYR